jgi:outer membrane lipoprotein-sorting protein
VKRRIGRFRELWAGRGAAGLVALGVSLIVISVLLVGTRNGSAPQEVAATQPFYLEATVLVLGSAATLAERQEEASSVIRWWYAANGRWRWEIEVSELESEPRTLIGVADGKQVWIFDASVNEYSIYTLRRDAITPPPVSVRLGPASIDDLAEQFEAQGVSFRSGGAGQHLGRDVEVYEYSPTWRASGSAGERSGGFGKLWYDAEWGFFLRNLVDGGATAEYVDARVIRLEIEPGLDGSLFRFEPPEGATKVEAN